MAKFDYTTKPAHPIKIMKIIRAFMNDLGVEREIVIAPKEPLKVDEYIKFIRNPANHQKAPLYFFVMKASENCAYNVINCMDELFCKIGINFETMADLGAKAVRNNAIERSSILRGFSYLTFVLLHEAGHHVTVDDYDEDEECPLTFEEVAKILINSKNEWDFQQKIQSYYYSLHNEQIATNWAIDWLSNAENRKKAKAFEKAFFKAWRG